MAHAGKQKQQKRTTTFFEFCNADKGTLLCTDVAARGLDIPGALAPSLRLHMAVLCCAVCRTRLACAVPCFRAMSMACTSIILITPAAVDWIIQFDPPDDPREYIHRVGRTARGRDGKGRALLLLMPEELPFLKYLKDAKVGAQEGCVCEVCVMEVSWRGRGHSLHKYLEDA